MAVDRKEQILVAAYEIVGQEGLEGLHARSVAAKVGINHAAVHYYYPKRGDLLVAVAGYAISRFARDREKLLSGAVAPGPSLEAHLAQAEVYCKPNSRFLKNWVSLFVAAIADEDLRKLLSDHLCTWAYSLGMEIEQGAKSGAVRRASPFVNPELLVASLLGLMLLSQSLGEEFDAGERLDLIAGSLLA
jgi:AcrR family transcriptional regulator